MTGRTDVVVKMKKAGNQREKESQEASAAKVAVLGF